MEFIRGGSMKDDVECPYCGKEQEKNHNDGYGRGEDTYQQECPYCQKIFVYNTGIIWVYDCVGKAPGLNDGEHEWVDKEGFPEEFFVGKQRCRICGEERDLKEGA
jgi:hypothetical protein